MNGRTIWVVLGSIVAGLLLGTAIRKARVGSAGVEVAALPSQGEVGAALLRAEMLDLDARLHALKEEGERIERERKQLTTPPPTPSVEDLVRSDLRDVFEHESYQSRTVVQKWLREDPSNVLAFLKLVAGAFREEDRGRRGPQQCLDYITYCYLHPNQFREVPAEGERITRFLAERQQTEPDLLLRGWMLAVLDAFKVALTPEQAAELARSFRESSDPVFRDAAAGLLLKDPDSIDVVREAISRGGAERSSILLKAWERRAFPPAELRRHALDIMKSDHPESMIMESQAWVPKFINPLAPEETVRLFNGTLAKPIDPLSKSISLMVMGSIASLFPARPGRAEIGRFAEATDDPKLKEFAAKVGAMVDEGKSFAEIRQLNPLDFGITYPR